MSMDQSMSSSDEADFVERMRQQVEDQQNREHGLMYIMDKFEQGGKKHLFCILFSSRIREL